MKLTKEGSTGISLYVMIGITGLLFVLGVSMMIVGGTVPEYDYSVKVTPVDNMENIDSSEIVKYSSLTEYEKDLIQNALENSGAYSQSVHYETVENDKDVVTNNRIVNINGVISYVNISESVNMVSDREGRRGFGFLATSIVLFFGLLASVSERES